MDLKLSRPRDGHFGLLKAISVFGGGADACNFSCDLRFRPDSAGLGKACAESRLTAGLSFGNQLAIHEPPPYTGKRKLEQANPDIMAILESARSCSKSRRSCLASARPRNASPQRKRKIVWAEPHVRVLKHPFASSPLICWRAHLPHRSRSRAKGASPACLKAVPSSARCLTPAPGTATQLLRRLHRGWQCGCARYDLGRRAAWPHRDAGVAIRRDLSLKRQRE
jgi:hypothetical protein